MLTESQREQLQQGAAQWGVMLDSEMLERFDRFAVLLEEGNLRLNLTRVAPEDVVTLHFLDSLALAAVLKPESGTHLIDVGTGAGFPGVPLALAFPEVQVVLLDGTRKRLLFLDEVIADLGLTNTQTLHGRAEEIARFPEHANRYDLVTARAVAKLPTLAAWMLPLVRQGGAAIAYKSREMEEEIEAARPVIAKLHSKLERVEEVAIPYTDIVRKLIIIRKLGRHPGTASLRRKQQR